MKKKKTSIELKIASKNKKKGISGQKLKKTMILEFIQLNFVEQT